MTVVHGLINRNPYERLYRSRDGGLLWGLEPGRLVAAIDEWASGGTVLDLGCGDGKNALFLERRGYRVVGVDASQTALAALRRRAADAGQAITGSYVVADVTSLAVRAAFDVVVSYGLYHCLGIAERAEVHRRLLHLVVPDGVVLFCSLTNGLPPPPDHFDTPVSLPSEDEILDLFRDDFRIEHRKTDLLFEAHPPLVGMHEHEAIWIVARRLR